jgi:hypothetical protein
MTVRCRGVLIALFAMFVSRSRVFFRLFVFAHIVMVGRLMMMMMRGGVVMSGRQMLMLARRMPE